MNQQKRQKYVLDRQWQLSVFRNTVVVAMLAGIAHTIAVHYIAQLDPIDRWSGQQLELLALAANGVFLGIIFVGLYVVSIRLTHAVVGPAILIQRAVEGLARKQFDSRLSLRKRDYLKPLAASLDALRHQLRESDEEARRLCTELTASLQDGDVTHALELTRELQALHEPPGSSDAPHVDVEEQEPEPVAAASHV